MPYSIKPSQDGKYILVTVQGDMTRALAMEHNRESHALGRKLGIRRYLVDLRKSRNVESLLDGYQFAYQDMPQQPEIDRSARVAILVSPGDHSHDFIETVSRNSGLDVTLFRDYEQAIAHLTGD
jgi:hypothetical protein